MIRLAIVFCISLTKISPLGQSASKYQMGMTTGVKTHLEAGGGPTDAASYDVYVKVGSTIYVVLYTPPLGENTVKYAAGRDLLLLVGKNKITYNDILGRSYEVPIESQRTAARPKQAASHAVE